MPDISFYMTSSLPSSLGDIKNIIFSLPFGKSEQFRLLSKGNEQSLLQSLAALLALNDLTNYLCCAPDKLKISRDANGKPYFETLPLFFSLSHIKGLAVAAVCTAKIGIDIEWLDNIRNISAISNRFFNDNEQHQIAHSNDPNRTFLSIWTKKEAYAKMTGAGLFSMYSHSSNESVSLRQYILEADTKTAVLSICADTNEDIRIHAPNKEIKLYELQN